MNKLRIDTKTRYITNSQFINNASLEVEDE